jgi:hypothetical protein
MFGDRLFLPATGYRHFNSGALDNHGIYGHYWTSRMGNTPNGYGAYGVYFESTSPHMGNTDLRTFGQSIRCIEED